MSVCLHVLPCTVCICMCVYLGAKYYKVSETNAEIFPRSKKKEKEGIRLIRRNDTIRNGKKCEKETTKQNVRAVKR